VAVTEPVAAFSANVTSGSAPLYVQFTDGSANTPTSWRWSFGDGETSTLQDPVHEYTADGSYSVTLKATNDEGSNSTTLTKYINVSTTSAPGTSFTAAVTSGTAPFTVQFTDTSTSLPTAWEWSFGDGSSSTQQNPSHTYVSTGTYTVSLTATNAGGSQVATRTNYITVSPADSLSPAPAAVNPETNSVELITNEPTAIPVTTATTTAAQGGSGSMLPIIGVIALIGAAIAAMILIRRRPPGTHHSRGGNL
jgi:PKD repeat protein